MKNKIINEILSGLKDNNIKFTDLRNVILNLGFYERIKGDHYIYTKEQRIFEAESPSLCFTMPP